MLGVLLAASRGEISLSGIRIVDIYRETGMLSVLSRTARIAFFTALFTCSLSYFIGRVLCRAPKRLTGAWLGTALLGGVSSPYILVQGWIGLLGQNGIIQRLSGGSHYPTFIYSEAGVVVFLSLLHLPIATLLMILDGKNFPSNHLDAAKLLRFRGWTFFRHVEIPRYGCGVASAFVWVFLLAFWSYDVPSALRQNVFSGEILAAFGAFFDYGRAISLVIPVLIVGLLVAALATWPTALIVSRASRGRASSTERCSFLSLCLIWIAPVALLVLPFLGLVFEIPSWRVFVVTLSAAREDIVNTIRNGLLMATLTTGISFAAGSLLYITRLRRLGYPLQFLQFFLIALPGSLVGIGAAGLASSFRGSIGGWIMLPLWLSEFSTVLPVTLILMLLIIQRMPREWQGVSPLFQMNSLRQFRSILLPELRGAVLMIFVVSFALIIRETPASLLTYPPGGATLALTIDSMLHFNQPAQIASLCLAQLAILAILSVAAFIAYALFERHASS